MELYTSRPIHYTTYHKKIVTNNAIKSARRIKLRMMNDGGKPNDVGKAMSKIPVANFKTTSIYKHVHIDDL